MVTRDRASEYERGVNLEAPQATQVLDRWHLLKNLRKACERQLRCFQQAIDAVATEVKLIKRSMFGRRSFDLLRKRILLAN